MPREALIVGLGQIGGSAGYRLQERGWRVRYIDPHVETSLFERATEIDDESMLVLATPVDAAVQILRDMKPRRGPVTSVCSVMRPLRDVARGRFVAGHPIAGTEQGGFAAAKASMFDGKRWFLDGEDAAIEELVRDCDATPERVDAAEHDAAVALTSHLPQILSTALAAHVADHQDVLRFAGTGLGTFLRLAGSDASIWKSILDTNHDNIAPHADAVARIVREMLSGDPTEVFAKAQSVWRRL